MLGSKIASLILGHKQIHRATDNYVIRKQPWPFFHLLNIQHRGCRIAGDYQGPDSRIGNKPLTYETLNLCADCRNSGPIFHHSIISRLFIAVDQSISRARWYSQVVSNRKSALAGNSSSSSQRIIITGILGNGKSCKEASP